MKQIFLYINGSPVDMGDDELIIYNYTLDDLNNPTIIRNSYSCNVTLPLTKQNNQVFNSFLRSDRITADKFDASVKTPFVIYDIMGTIRESGYISLMSATSKGYEITLYGGLGSFLYGLKVNADGDSRTLADLEYLNTTDSAKELDFTINADAVRAAWQTLRTGTGANKWKVVNFAPCYNGITDGFDHDKILINTTGYPNVPSSGGGKSARNGYVLATLPEALNEWKVCDLRSYLQRPVLNMGAFLDAVSKPKNNGGWSVTWHGNNWFTRASWLTLPLLTANDKYGRTSSLSNVWGIRGHAVPVQKSGNVRFWWQNRDMLQSRKSSGSATVTAKCRINARIGVASGEFYDSGVKMFRATCFQIVGRDVDGNIVAKSKVYAFTNNYYGTGTMESTLSGLMIERDKLTDGMANIQSNRFICAPDSEIEVVRGHYIDGKFTTNDSENDYFDFEISGDGIDRYEIRYKTIWENHSYIVNSTDFYAFAGITAVYANTSDYNYQKTARLLDFSITDETISYEAMRSGADVSKADILTTDFSPADLLVSLARLNGWYFVADQATKTVHIYDRESFYNSETVDISELVDMTTAKVTPIAAESKYYDFAYPESYGKITADFAERTGRKYGSVRVNTGYEFEVSPVDQMDGIIFKGAPMLTDVNKQYSTYVPGTGSITYFGWQMKPITYTFGDKATGTADEVVAPKAPATITAFNAKGVEYGDAISKVQLFDAEGKSEAGNNVLLYFDRKYMRGNCYYQVSDDTAEMLYQNEGVPCYLLDPYSATTWLSPTEIPFFRRAYISNNPYNSNALVQNTWDFQAPTENNDFNFPNVDVDGGIYPVFWKSLITDRYNKDTRVITLKVNLHRLNVSYEMFRSFYYFDGCLWVLNKVKDYALCSDELATCEFIKVQDTNNY